jgi:hypothetical protein
MKEGLLVYDREMKEAAFLSKAENEGGGAFLSMTEMKEGAFLSKAEK